MLHSPRPLTCMGSCHVGVRDDVIFGAAGQAVSGTMSYRGSGYTMKVEAGESKCVAEGELEQPLA